MTRDEIFGRIVAMIKEQMHVTDLEVTEAVSYTHLTLPTKA